MLLPILMAGAFALILKTFPIPAYQHFISSFYNGFLYSLFDTVYFGTFGVLSVYMTITVAISYQRETGSSSSLRFGQIITALSCFFILSGILEKGFSINFIGVKGMITALLSGYFSSLLFECFHKIFNHQKIYSDGADVRFNRAISVITPSGLTVFIFAVVNKLLVAFFNVSSFQALITKAMQQIFMQMNSSFSCGLLFVVMSSFLWFFGIHGSDCLDTVSSSLFSPQLAQNIVEAYSGSAPTHILTKQFFDVFVLMGGCGTSISLLIALFIFGKRRSDRNLSKLALLPAVFNINEIILFGIPVILNPILLIPFMITPIVCYVTSFTAMKLGLVALTVKYVEWTTPVILGGYLATGSISGSLLQLFNIVIGVFIYAPFIRILDRQKVIAAKENYRKLVEYYRGCEESSHYTNLLEMENDLGGTAKVIAADLGELLKGGGIRLFYQPQIDSDGRCYGVEALLRWKHPLFDMIYPPLLVKLADEIHMLPELEKQVLQTALNDMPALREQLGSDFILSVNVTDKTLRSDGFIDYLKKTVPQDTKLCLEITEQAALRLDNYMRGILSLIKQMNILLAIDDFSMGQTSIRYLREENFDLVKLDGSLVRGILDDPRCLEIVSSIVSLSKKLSLNILAEYVENTETRDKLYSLGCTLYQGYLYSKALPPDEIKKSVEARLRDDDVKALAK